MPMFSYVYNIAWKEMTDAENLKSGKLPKKGKGGIDKFLHIYPTKSSGCSSPILIDEDVP